jgi:hypothetical protein
VSQKDQASIKLHESLIRLAKGMITAWEEWLNYKKGKE